MCKHKNVHNILFTFPVDMNVEQCALDITRSFITTNKDTCVYLSRGLEVNKLKYENSLTNLGACLHIVIDMDIREILHMQVNKW